MRLFGSDGIRGVAGTYPLDASTLTRIGQVIHEDLGAGVVVVGRDTRPSGRQICEQVLGMLKDADVLDLGIVPTPAVACETKSRHADLGIMITASHNPAKDNGLKFFGSDGFKISRERAKQWEQRVAQTPEISSRTSLSCQTVSATHYEDLVRSHFQQDWGGLKVIFDLAHGAAVNMVPRVCRSIGLDAQYLAGSRDGERINAGVGALHPHKLAEQVLSQRADVGFAFDGDADRLVVVDRHGNCVPGDVVMYILAQCYVREGKNLDRLFGTVLSGQGLEDALRGMNIALERTPVGDQHILDGLRSTGALFGGEPSGHLIQMDLLPAGDGLLAALRILRHLTQDSDLIVKARQAVPSYPTYESNIQVNHKPDIHDVPALRDLAMTIERALDGTGRWVLRYSGTEPLLRVFAETKHMDTVKPMLDSFCRIAKEVLNG